MKHTPNRASTQRLCCANAPCCTNRQTCRMKPGLSYRVQKQIAVARCLLDPKDRDYTLTASSFLRARLVSTVRFECPRGETKVRQRQPPNFNLLLT